MSLLLAVIYSELIMQSITLNKRETSIMQITKSIKIVLLLMVGVLSLAACSSNKPQVNIDKTQNFADLKTFYIQPPLNPINTTLANHLSSSITERLIEKGLTPTSEQSADIAVGYLPSTATKEDGTTLNLGLGTGTFGRSGGISLGSIFSIPVGEQTSLHQGLQIDMVKDGTFIYSASGTVELEAKDSISIQNRLDELVIKLLAQFPPNK